MDSALVARLRARVADVLARQRQEDALAGMATMGPEDERQYARAVIAQVLEAHVRAEIAAGRTPPSPEEDQEIADGIHAALFGVGRLQPLLDDPLVENIDINGCDRVFVGYADGREVLADPVADSDEELIDLVQTHGPSVAGALVNAASLTHSSIGLRDAFLGVGIPVVEVHLSNIHRREDFRGKSYLADIAVGVVTGFGATSYRLGLAGLIDHLRRRDT